MKNHLKFQIKTFAYILLAFISFATQFETRGQLMKNEDVAPFTPYLNGNDHDIYGINNRFIENVGQYGVSYPDKPNMVKIKFGYEGFGIPVLFTSKGLIYLHRKISGPTLEEKEKEERRKNKKKKEEEK